MQVKTGLMNAFYTALQTLYNIVSILIPFAVGAGMVASGLITAGEVIIFYGISTSVGVSFTNISTMPERSDRPTEPWPGLLIPLSFLMKP